MTARRSSDPVIGPNGTPMTLSSLPAPPVRRWVALRKAEVVAAVQGGLLSAEQACARYGIAPEELESWQSALKHLGVRGLFLKNKARLHKSKTRGAWS